MLFLLGFVVLELDIYPEHNKGPDSRTLRNAHVLRPVPFIDRTHHLPVTLSGCELRVVPRTQNLIRKQFMMIREVLVELLGSC